MESLYAISNFLRTASYHHPAYVVADGDVSSYAEAKLLCVLQAAAAGAGPQACDACDNLPNLRWRCWASLEMRFTEALPSSLSSALGVCTSPKAGVMHTLLLSWCYIPGLWAMGVSCFICWLAVFCFSYSQQNSVACFGSFLWRKRTLDTIIWPSWTIC